MNLIIIPARSGSKRLKNKNLLALSGKPLITYTIDAAKKCNIPNKMIYVSTDSEEIKKIAENNGVNVPFLRSKKNSSDEATSIDMIKEVIGYFPNIRFESITLLQPTSPLRTYKHIDEAFDIFDQNGKNIISVTEALFNNHTYTMNKLNDSMVKYEISEKVYSINGAIYIIKNDLIDLNNYTNDFLPYIMEKIESIDIDYKSDFILAEQIIESGIIR